ncbi:hypothetical protein A5742_12570 [Mycolicibacterium fortuitum]|uniref:Uncharacterized protein n=1 Tax=Mycolicibacterium fortuitum TaxID=1766 RepID=A0ABD6QDX8_MYCFO|nr:hypothetical protein [Mycolicibacterium fortuitum]OMC35497.1 hypothetical protein A5742_12570 [Mycolicibacterium fortuitum]
MTEAIEAWSRYPEQIEAGIPHYPGRHIREWHQGQMSSRELLVLLKGLPADSWFKTSVHADLALMRSQADRDALEAARAQTDGMLTGEIRSEVPLEVTVAEKRRPTKE